MRKSRSETVAQHREQFLAGKSEEYKNKFDQKNLDQQYAAIANWKRNAVNLEKSTEVLAKVSVANVISHLKDAHKKLVKLENLSEGEAKKIHNMLDKVKDSVINFEKTKKQQLLDLLKAEKEQVKKQSEKLEQRIQELHNELQNS